MKYISTDLLFTICAFAFLLFSCTNKEPFIADYTNVKGYVIAQEKCNVDESKDYWLVDLTYLQDTPRYGDTIMINNTTYNNVVKVKGLDQRLRHVDMRVSFDFKTISPNKIETTGCTVGSPVTYRLKELFIINQGEIR